MPAAPAKKKRRWLRYTLISLGAVVLLVIGVVLAIVAYSNSLVKTYTQSQQQTFPSIDTSKEAMERLKGKFAAFQQELNTSKGAVRPLELSADELNVALANLAGVRNGMRVVIEGDQLKAKFSLPLGNPGQPKLKGKFLNGEAKLDVKLENGFLKTSIASVQANNKPLPKWAVSMMRKQNPDWFDKNYDSLEFFQKLESIQVRDGSVVLTPYYGQ